MRAAVIVITACVIAIIIFTGAILLVGKEQTHNNETPLGDPTADVDSRGDLGYAPTVNTGG